MRVRKALYWVHLYAGLTIGLLVTVIGLTGSLVVFQPEIDRFLNPALYRVPSGEVTVSADRALAAARAAHAYGPARFAVMRPPSAAGDTYEFLLKEGFAHDHGPFVKVHVDPRTGEVLGNRVSEDTLVGKLIGLHVHLLVGEEHGPGQTIVGLGGVVLLVFGLTGLVLWWPGLRRLPTGFRVAWKGGTTRLNFDLHRVLGVVLVVPLFALALTGVYLVFPGYVRPIYTAFVDAPRPPAAPHSKPVPGATAISVEAAMVRARQAIPAARVTSVQIPGRDNGVYAVRMKSPEDPDQHYSNGKTLVYVDQYDGAVLAVRNARNLPTGSRVVHDWLFPTHTGEIAGLAGRWIAFFAGLTPAVLYLTGLVVWWNRRKLRKARQTEALCQEQVPA